MAPTFPVGSAPTQEERATETVETLQMWKYPGGITLGSFRFGQHTLGYGDLVFVRDSRAKNVVSGSGLLKRVVALGGDTLELRDGSVWRNGERIVEPYTLKPRSTYGGPSIPECTPITLPPDTAVVLGDNRKQSDDSRFVLGVIPLNTIQRYYPWEKQLATFGDRWRSGEEAVENGEREAFDSTDFIARLNALRKEQGLEPLANNRTLSNMATTRAQLWLGETPPATQSGALFTLAEQQGYFNPLLAELPISGHYTSDELIETIRQVSGWGETLLKPDYHEIGVAVRLSEGECPRQYIVIFMGGYVPAKYDPSMVQSWQQALAKLKEVLPGWLELEQQSHTLNDDQKKQLGELLGIMEQRIARIESLTRTMQRREWMSPEQERWLDEDAALAERQFTLSTSLNNR